MPEVGEDILQIDAPTRQYDTGHKRTWVCPKCGHEEKRHPSSRTRPFCDPCDWQHAIHIEMEPHENGVKVSFDD